MPEISFFEQFEWSEELDAMIFWAGVDDEAVTCRITAPALRLLGDQDDPEPDKVELFMHNTQTIHRIAEQLIRERGLEDRREVIIDEQVCRRLA